MTIYSIARLQLFLSRPNAILVSDMAHRPILSADIIGEKFSSRTWPIKAGDKIGRFYRSSVIGLTDE